jgi:beta-aspartyl-peptidase (threonine type)
MRKTLSLLVCGLVLVSGIGAGSKQTPPAFQKQMAKPARTVLVLHGGVGVLTEAEMAAEGLTREDFEKALTRALLAGYQTLERKGKTSVDAVEAAVRVLEDCELFNAGRGAAFNSDGRVELDAAIMEGNMDGAGPGKRDPRKRAGAVTGVAHIKNPISAARAVMEMEGSRHVMLAGDGAEAYVFSEPVRSRYQIERVSNIYFWTDRRLRHIRSEFDRSDSKLRKKDSPRGLEGGADRRFGTVGAVALDGNKHLAAATSTGGLTNKLPGRVGDSPIIGAGTYADDRACAVSCTGTGEVFMRHAVAHDVVARILYGRKPVEEAAREAIAELPDEEGGVGGLIALDRSGRHVFALSKKCLGMYRGYVTEDGEVRVAVFSQEPEKSVSKRKTGATAQ